MREADTRALLHAAGELVQNAVDHAFGPGRSGVIEVHLDLDDQGLSTLRVCDPGPWREQPPAADRGFGLAITRSLVDGLEIERHDRGTVVRVQQRLRRDAGPLDIRLPHAPAGEEFDVWHHRVDDRLVVGVAGPLDAAAVGELRTHLGLATAPGQAPARLDLTRATR